MQITPSDKTIVFMGDYPTTDNYYSTVAVLDGPDADLLAQYPPGTAIHLLLHV